MACFRFFFIISFTILFAVSCKKLEKQQLEQKDLELSATIGGFLYLDTTHTIHIATTLFNPTNDTLSFVTMTCSYEDMFITDTSIFKIESRYDCYSNYPIDMSIPPKSKLDQLIMVKPISRTINISDQKLRVGMYLIKPEMGFGRIIDQYRDRKSARIIWSNQLDLKRLFRKVYN